MKLKNMTQEQLQAYINKIQGMLDALYTTGRNESIQYDPMLLEVFTAQELKDHGDRLRFHIDVAHDVIIKKYLKGA